MVSITDADIGSRFISRGGHLVQVTEYYQSASVGWCWLVKLVRDDDTLSQYGWGVDSNGGYIHNGSSEPHHSDLVEPDAYKECPY